VLSTANTFTLSAQVENLTFTGAGNFTGTGNAVNNVITGGAGNDTLDGNAGDDTLLGGAGSDNLIGGQGIDRLTGGAGNDTMSGGAGDDIFLFAAGLGNDTISDFDAIAQGGQDLLNVSALGITAANFATRVTVTDLGADMLIQFVGTTDTITLLGVNGNGQNVITAQDFILAA